MFQRGQGDAERLCLEEANALLGELRPRLGHSLCEHLHGTVSSLSFAAWAR